MERGNDMWEKLAEQYQQLYLSPGKEGMEQYPEIVLHGKNAEKKSLSHFRKCPEDCYFQESTPAGEVSVVLIHDRTDFERFLQIMGEKCEPVPIPPTQGAAILDGLINWQKARAYQRESFFRALSGGADAPAPDYKDALIVLSWEPYSGVSAERAGVAEKDWLEKSYLIRRYHECTHFVCRRLYPEKISAVWDEVIADAAGILAAFGEYSPELAETFLGIRNGRYTGGRLANYVAADDDMDAWADYCRAVMERVAARRGVTSPFELAMDMEEHENELRERLPRR